MLAPEHWPNPITTRSLVMLQIAAELVSGTDMSIMQAKVLLKAQGTDNWKLSLYATGAFDGVDAIVSGEANLATINPSVGLMLAYKGMGPYDKPQPVRTIGVIPSLDQYVFAVRPDTGLMTVEDIATRCFPLRVSMRGQRNHCLNIVLNDITAAAGFTLNDLRKWGGDPRYEALLPWPESEKFKALVRGDLDAIIDEAAYVWVDAALDAGMRILPLSEATVKKLEAIGYRRAYLKKSAFPKLPGDILTLDFSGWPIFVHSELPDAMVARLCAALEARKHLIGWEGEGPLPVERMCRDAEDTPQQVPLHPAAERYWRKRGYLA
jgi:TRAP-type uncharacterized transport system substrate-binding protein